MQNQVRAIPAKGLPGDAGMRELLYLSPTKLEAFYLQNRGPRIPQEFEVSALGNSIHIARPVPEGAPDPFLKLARVAKQLKKKAKASADPTLGPGEWFIFDCEMTYGVARNGPGKDVALFVVPAVFGADGGISMFGTAGNLIGRAPESEPYHASSLEWLADVVEADEFDYPTGLYGSRPDIENEYIRAALIGAVRRLNARNPILPRARLSGLARVLCTCPPARNFGHGSLTVGTPLYVELGPWNPKW